MPKTSPTPRLPAVLTRVSSFEPRPVGTVPECVPLPRHTLDEDSPANGNVSRAGDCCGEGGLGSSRRWHDHRPASRTGQGGSCLSSARNSRFLPLPRPEQLRVEGSPFRVEGGRPLPCLKGRRPDRPDQSRRSHRPAQRRPPPRHATAAAPRRPPPRRAAASRRPPPLRATAQRLITILDQ